MTGTALVIVLLIFFQISFRNALMMGFSSPVFGRNEGLWSSIGKASLIWGDPCGACRLTAMDSRVWRHSRHLLCYWCFNPLFPHEHRTLTTPAMADCSWGFHTGIAYDRKHCMCKLVLWLATSMQGAFDGRLTSFVYNFKVGTWKKIPQLNIVRPIYYYRRVTQFLLQEHFLCWFTSSMVVLVFDVEEY